MEEDKKLQGLIKVISQLLQLATSYERLRLQSSIQLLGECATIQPRRCIVDLLSQELHDQIAWANIYRGYQSQPDVTTVQVDNCWRSASFDRDDWLHEFANEVLEGAETICMILDQSPEHIHVREGWIPVFRRSRSSRADDDQCSASEFDDLGEGEVPIGGDDAEFWGPKEPHEDDGEISELGPKKLCFWYF